MKTTLVLILSVLCGQAFANRQSGGRPQGYAVYVDFRSYGSGIDGNARNIYTRLVNEAVTNNDVVDQTNESYGRKGESRECVNLTDAIKHYYFISRLAPSILEDKKLHGRQRTAVYAGFRCGDFDSAIEQDLSIFSR